MRPLTNANKRTLFRAAIAGFMQRSHSHCTFYLSENFLSLLELGKITFILDKVRERKRGGGVDYSSLICNTHDRE